MGDIPIRSGQVWVANLYGHETRVLVIGTYGEIHQTWICEKLMTGQGFGTGPHVTLNEKAFLRPDSLAEEVPDRHE